MTKISEMPTDELVDALSRALTDNCSVHYALGYLKATLAQVIDQLPAGTRDRELTMLRRVLKDELTLLQTKQEIAMEKAYGH